MTFRKKSIRGVLFLSMIFQNHFVMAREQTSATQRYDATDISYRKKAEEKTIQELAQQASSETNRGKNLANAAIGISTAGVIASCTSFFGGVSGKCKWWVAGLAASVMVRANMRSASAISAGTLAAVSTNPDDKDLGKGKSSISTDQDYQSTPEWIAAQAQIKKLTDAGWKIDTKSGNITTPNGKTYSATSVSSPSAMRAAGATESEIKDFQEGMSKVSAVAAEKAKAADGSATASGEDIGIGGGMAHSTPTTAMGVAEGDVRSGILSEKSKLGVSRDPAQVEGMSKIYNGSPIGVAADSVFGMIDRRYQLHEKKGSFLTEKNGY